MLGLQVCLWNVQTGHAFPPCDIVHPGFPLLFQVQSLRGANDKRSQKVLNDPNHLMVADAKLKSTLIAS